MIWPGATSRFFTDLLQSWREYSSQDVESKLKRKLQASILIRIGNRYEKQWWKICLCTKIATKTLRAITKACLQREA